MEEVLKELRDINTRLAVIEAKSEMSNKLLNSFVTKTNDNSLAIGKVQTHAKYSFTIFTGIFLTGWTALAVFLRSIKH